MILVVGGAGFVGLNIVAALAASGRAVTVLDRAPLPDAAMAAGVQQVTGDVTDPDCVARALVPGVEAVVLGAALTAGPARESDAPEAILQVNLLSQIGILRRARAVGVRRVLNLSSAAAYGVAAAEVLAEDGPVAPESLYAITKYASERVGMRLGRLWGLDVRHVRLSAVFGPWERDTGARDTISPMAQMLAAAGQGAPALLPRPGRRDWIYAPDVARGVLAVLDAPAPRHELYNIAPGVEWTALAWGQALAARRPGFVCRLAEPGEAPTIDLHGSYDRPMLAPDRLRDEFGWLPQFDCAQSAAHLDDWSRAHAA